MGPSIAPAPQTLAAPALPTVVAASAGPLMPPAKRTARTVLSLGIVQKSVSQGAKLEAACTNCVPGCAQEVCAQEDSTPPAGSHRPYGMPFACNCSSHRHAMHCCLPVRDAECTENPGPAPANSVFACPSPTTPGSVCNGTCASGYSGSPYATCQADGTYSAVTRECLLIGKCRF